MANVTPENGWQAGIYRIETTDPVSGGETGIANKQAKQLLANDIFLKGETDTLKSSTFKGASTIADVSGSRTFMQEDNNRVLMITSGITQYVLNADVNFPLNAAGQRVGQVIVMGDAGVAFAIQKPTGIELKYAGSQLTGSKTSGATGSVAVNIGQVAHIFMFDSQAIVYIVACL